MPNRRPGNDPRIDEFRYSVVIPTKDRARIVLRTARSLGEQTRRPERVVLVDASDPPLEVPPALGAELARAGIELVALSAPPSTSGQRNVGIDVVETPLVMFMDDDVELPPEYAETLLERWRREGLDRLAGIVGALSGNPVPRSLASRVFRRLFGLHYYDPTVAGTRFRLSQKLRYNDATRDEIFVESTSTMAVVYRTDLARKHRFDQHFDGYVLGEDHDFAYRVAREGPILLVPSVQFVHVREPGERSSPRRWHNRGRKETYFRLRRLERSPAARAAFAASVLGELAGAAVDSVRERDASHVRGYVGGLRETLLEVRAERSSRLSLRPTTYYALNHTYRRMRIARARRNGCDRLLRDGVRILGYHRVTTERDPLAVRPDDLRRQLEWLLEQGMRPLRMDEALDLLRTPVDGRFFVVSFDDGYADNAVHGLPILEDLGIPAAIYVATAVIDRLATFSWYRRPPAALTWDELRALQAGGLIHVGAHTRTHRILPRLPLEAAREEVEGSRRDLERQLGRTPTTFAYPAGIYGRRELELVAAAGFRGALSTLGGVNRGGEGTLELRRTLVLTGDTFDDFRAKVTGALDETSALERLVRTWRAAAAG